MERGRGWCRPTKSQRGKWVEEDMTMDPANTTNNCIEQEVGLEYSTWDEYFEKIVVCKWYVFRVNKQFKWAIVQINYIDDEITMDSMPPTINSNLVGIIVRNFPIWYK